MVIPESGITVKIFVACAILKHEKEEETDPHKHKLLKIYYNYISISVKYLTHDSLSNSAKGAQMSANDETLSSMLDKIVKNKIDANRRFVDEILEKIQNSNQNYYLQKFAEEMKAFESAMAHGQTQKAARHQIMADVYKSIAEKAFGASAT